MRYKIKFTLAKLALVFVTPLIWGCGSFAQSAKTLQSYQKPESLKFIETEDVLRPVNYTCFTLAEKTRDAYNTYLKSEQKETDGIIGKDIFLGSIGCSSEPTGQYAFVYLYLSTDENNSASGTTGPGIYATTSDGGKTFKWSLWSLGT